MIICFLMDTGKHIYMSKLLSIYEDTKQLVLGVVQLSYDDYLVYDEIIEMKFVKSVTHAIEGLGYVLREHANFRIHIALAFVAIVLGISLKLSNLELSILVITITLVLMAEILNTAVEELSDLITLRWSKHAKVAKDVSAGMVFLTSICAAIVGWLLFIPKLN